MSLVLLIIRIIIYTKKSLKSHDLSDFSLGEFFYSPFSLGEFFYCPF